MAGLILNWNQTISVQQILRVFHIGLGNGQPASEELADPHAVTISLGIGGCSQNQAPQDLRRCQQRGPQARPQTLTSLATSDTPINAALQPMKLFEGIGEGSCDVDSRFAVQPPLPGLAGHQRPHSEASV
jgi:hypothetical protein